MTAWDRVAAPGTDAGLLRALVTQLVDDGAATAAAVRAAIADGATVASAVRARAAQLALGSSEAVTAAAAAWSDAGVVVAVGGDDDDPVGARWPTWPEAPWLVARRGAPVPSGPAVAIVGARRATSYGRGIAAWLAESCGRSGVRVVSGGAVGIDAAAHEAALATVGGTTVVLGCGHAVPYPRPHHGHGALFERIVDAGGTLLSESLPAHPPAPFRVRERNRLLAALADVVVVVEGSERSGSLLTATAAAELGVPVLAVPGDVRAAGSGAPHRLLAEGAGVCRRPDDVLELLGATAVAPSSSGTGAGPALSGMAPAVAALLVEQWPRSVTLEELAVAGGTTPGALLAAVTRGRIDGLLAQGPEGIRLRRNPGG